MERKDFLQLSGLLLAGTSMGPVLSSTGSVAPSVCRKPPALRPGHLIGITSPAGFITPEDIQPAVQVLERWGLRVRTGNTIGRRDFTFGGTDDERLQDLQEMLDDKNINAIMCARGGYGSIRIVDRLRWQQFERHPKWLIGFSDITVLHAHIHANSCIATIHSKMTNSFPVEWSLADNVQMETIQSIRDALMGKRMEYRVPPNPMNRPGTAQGMLAGGNLKILESLAGTTSDLPAAGRILFLEDTGEYLYSIDRMFWNMKRTGKLAGLKGLVIGGFRIRPDDPGEEFARDLHEIVMEKVKEYNYPVCFDFPVGHQKANFALKCGVVHRLEVTRDSVLLSEQV